MLRLSKFVFLWGVGGLFGVLWWRVLCSSLLLLLLLLCWLLMTDTGTVTSFHLYDDVMIYLWR